MARLGMDPEVVERVGRDLQRQAAYLDAVIQQVDRLVSSGGGNWQGNKGRQFVADWQSHHRTAVVHCADSVRGLGQSALNNAQAQRGVSGSPVGGTSGGRADSHDAPGSAIPPWIKDVLPDFHNTFETLGGGLTGVAMGAFVRLSDNKMLVGRYTNGFHRFADSVSKLTGGRVGFDQLRYKQALNGVFSVNGPIPTLGKVFTGFSLASDLGGVLDGSRSNEERLGSAASGVATVLKGLKQTPIGYWGGAAIESVSLAASEAQKVDFSPAAVTMTWDYVKKNPGVIGESFVDAVKDVGPKLFKVFL